jgi:hypothetical protein
MSAEDKTLAEQPPAPRSFVSSKDAQKSEEVTSIMKVDGKEVHVLKPDVALTLIYGKLDAILTELKMLNGIFSKAAEPKSFQNAVPLASTKSSSEPSAPTPQPSTTVEDSPRIKEIKAALEPMKDLLNIDFESSTIFVIVAPARYLGSENFAKVAKIVRDTLGGQYVSAGKNSHFEIPKAPPKRQA